MTRHHQRHAVRQPLAETGAIGKRPISFKLVVLFMMLTAVPLIGLGTLNYLTLNNVEQTMSDYSDVLGEDILDRFEGTIISHVKQDIIERTHYVGVAVDAYLDSRPPLTEEEMMADQHLAAIAVQRIGERDYTAVLTSDAVTLFHPDPSIVGLDLHVLADRLPDFWAILEKSLMAPSEGYYEWDDGGVLKPKYMYCEPIEGQELTVCGTKYLESFDAIMAEMTGEVDQAKSAMDKSNTLLFSRLKNLFLVILLSVVFLGFLSTLFTAHSIRRPLIGLKRAAEQVMHGEQHIKPIKVYSLDEVGDAALAFNLMLAELEGFRRTIKKHEHELEMTVRKRTRELEKTVKAGEEAKSAMLNILEDVDESNKELQDAHKELERSIKELKKLDFQKDQFISIAAHELKTPLTSIKGFTDLLKNPAIVKDDEKRKRFLDIIYRDTQRLGELITNILELSRMDIGTLKLGWQTVTLKEILDECQPQIALQIKQESLRLVMDVLAKDMPLTVDLDKLIQVIRNLVNNAVHYTERGSITFRIEKRPKEILFSVIDTGQGIPKDQLEKIFERFYQVDGPLTRKIGGTGLGLAICKGFIEAMGGRIWAESIMGKGTTMRFTLPLKRADEGRERKSEIRLFDKDAGEQAARMKKKEDNVSERPPSRKQAPERPGKPKRKLKTARSKPSPSGK